MGGVIMTVQCSGVTLDPKSGMIGVDPGCSPCLSPPSLLPSLSHTLPSCLSQPGDRTKEQVLEAFGAWLRLSSGRSLPTDGTTLAAHPLTVAALSGLG